MSHINASVRSFGMSLECRATSELIVWAKAGMFRQSERGKGPLACFDWYRRPRPNPPVFIVLASRKPIAEPNQPKASPSRVGGIPRLVRERRYGPTNCSPMQEEGRVLYLSTYTKPFKARLAVLERDKDPTERWFNDKVEPRLAGPFRGIPRAPGLGEAHGTRCFRASL